MVIFKRAFLLQVLGTIMIFTAGCQYVTQNQIPLDNISEFNIVYEKGKVSFSWHNPYQIKYQGIVIRRRDDGQYPENASDGILIYKSSAREQNAHEFIAYDGSNNPASYYYTAFSYDNTNNFSSGVRIGLYCDESGCVVVPNLDNLSKIHSAKDFDSIRENVIDFIWGIQEIPSRLPDKIIPITDTGFEGVSQIMEITIRMDQDLSSIAYMFIPVAPRNRLLIYHQGHRGGFLLGKKTIERFISEGYHVLAFSMPLVGMNKSTDPEMTKHDHLVNLDRPMRFFLEPIAVALNYVGAEHNFEQVSMTGISGGGWTTIAYCAIDPRVGACYPVAGSYPIYIRTQIESSNGDFEQRNPDFYQLVSYIDLFILATSNRRQLQIFNKYDPCCFEGTYSFTYKDFVQEIVLLSGGSFDVIIDETHDSHAISDFAMEKILEDIEANVHKNAIR